MTTPRLGAIVTLALAIAASVLTIWVAVHPEASPAVAWGMYVTQVAVIGVAVGSVAFFVARRVRRP